MVMISWEPSILLSWIYNHLLSLSDQISRVLVVWVPILVIMILQFILPWSIHRISYCFNGLAFRQTRIRNLFNGQSNWFTMPVTMFTLRVLCRHNVVILAHSDVLEGQKLILS